MANTRLAPLVPPCKKCRTPQTVNGAYIALPGGRLHLYLHILCIMCGEERWLCWDTDGMYKYATRAIGYEEEDPLLNIDYDEKPN